MKYDKFRTSDVEGQKIITDTPTVKIRFNQNGL
jgi:hypothetical protein